MTHSFKFSSAASSSVEDDAIILGLEPLHAILLRQLVLEAHLAPAKALLHDAATWTCEVHVEIHAVDASAGIVLDSEVDVLGDAESKVASLAEVDLAQLVLLDLQALLQDLLRLLTTHGHVASNPFVTADAEGPDGQPGLGKHGLLLRELLEHLRGTRQAIATLANTDVEHQLDHLDLAHGVIRLVRHGCYFNLSNLPRSKS